MSFEINYFKGSPEGVVAAKSTRPALKGDEIFIEITHSGVCFTDCHYKAADLGLGHEGVGIVKAIGPDVKTFKIGDRAGWGYMHEVCRVCDQCFNGDWFYCTSPNKKIFGFANLDQGSFGSGAVWNEHYLFHIPDAMSSEDAAPFMCAGITVWSALTRFGLKPTDVVGVVGIGGLGHIALQFARAMGCEVVALSGSGDKKEEALQLGAHHFVATKDAKTLSVPRKINTLLITTSQLPDWNQYSSILAPLASIHPLTITDFETKLELPFMLMLMNGWKVIMSSIPPKKSYDDMLGFAALHRVKPTIQRFPLNLEGVKESLLRLDEGTIRYRGVLCADMVN